MGVRGVEPANNTAERALRCAVLWGASSLGHRATRGLFRRTYPDGGIELRTKHIMSQTVQHPKYRSRGSEKMLTLLQRGDMLRQITIGFASFTAILLLAFKAHVTVINLN